MATHREGLEFESNGGVVTRGARLNAEVAGHSAALNRLGCSVIGHDWMRNGVSPLRIGGRWLGTSPDWQTCLRCSRWELVLELAVTPLNASSGPARGHERLQGGLDSTTGELPVNGDG